MVGGTEGQRVRHLVVGAEFEGPAVALGFAAEVVVVAEAGMTRAIGHQHLHVHAGPHKVELAGDGEVVIDVVGQREHQPAETHLGAHGQARAVGQEGGAAVFGTHAALGQHASAVGELAGLANVRERGHPVLVAV
ncbi:hypothetical protein D9M68_687170 [compost metagenome]